MNAAVARLISRSAFFLGIFSLLSVGVAWFWLSYTLNRSGPHQVDKIVEVSIGDGHTTVRGKLKLAGILHQIYHYDAARIFAGDEFVPKAGEFLFPAQANLRKVMDVLHDGKSIQRRITIIEGQKSSRIVEMINGMPKLIGNINQPVEEGSMFPDTYFYTYGTKRADLIARMQEKLQMNLAEAWLERQTDLPYTAPKEALIMASIIEQEASNKSERKLVSAVLVNRLKLGMRLQSDPTVRYGIDHNSSLAISKSDLQRRTPWNTYMIKGLPKTPICNPSLESIDAALNPADSSYLYFVSDGFGGLRFSKTLDVHNKNVKLLRQIQLQKPKGSKP